LPFVTILLGLALFRGKLLVKANEPQAKRTSEVSNFIRTVRHLRPALVPA
jgi:hypothetical protein